jgi:hypothetical protein
MRQATVSSPKRERPSLGRLPARTRRRAVSSHLGLRSRSIGTRVYVVSSDHAINHIFGPGHDHHHHDQPMRFDSHSPRGAEAGCPIKGSGLKAYVSSGPAGLRRTDESRPPARRESTTPRGGRRLSHNIKSGTEFLRYLLIQARLWPFSMRTMRSMRPVWMSRVRFVVR